MYLICSNDGYYTGETYMVQGERFAIFEWNIDKAKKYKSLKRAENSAIRLMDKCTNCCNYFGGVHINKLDQ